MSWYIASIPFWILGTIALVGPVVSLFGARTHRTTSAEATAYTALFAASGGFYYVAARLVS